MRQCPSCTRAVPENQPFCGECGALTAAPADVTQTSVESSFSGGVTRDPQSGARFLPGSMIAGRYRVVGLLGRGGMGEVYRADDLKLGQQVALKLLPREFENDPARLERFLNEVRSALRVTHPNICRVFDVGEVDGQHYLSMEYVDGEDLASLLRRIGRLPQDKAVEISRQLCAGLAAAHGEGILHRDLKPANVMIDGRGRAKITDFGLAGATRGIAGAEARAGTPGYMAPEQLSGEALTERTDVYALGLLLYELFTGKKAYPAENAAEMARLQREATPTSLSSHVDGIEPAVERVIRRCLEPQPNDRPAGALSVAAALPGGDPLAAALAAGETPSPEMVAAAGEAGALSPLRAVAALAFFLAALACLVTLAPHLQMVHRMPMDKPTQALTVKAREIVADLGYDAEAADRAWGFYYSRAYSGWLEERNKTAERWDDVGEIRPRPLGFWYRESPRALVPLRFQGNVSSGNPPMTITAMVRVRLDTDGNLQEFLAVPPERDDAISTDVVEPDWGRMFEHAGISIAEFDPAPPEWVPPRFADIRRAWTGTYPGRPDVPIRIESAAYRGRPVYFEVVAPWTEATGMTVEPTPIGQRVANVILLALLALILVGGGLLVRRNRRLGRLDVRGASRLAGFVFVVTLAAWVLGAHHVADLAEVGLFMIGIVPQALLVAGLVVLIYLALEPYARKLWPEALISWNRLLAGRFRDPRVGRDVLLGACVGIAMNLIVILIEGLPRWTDAPGAEPMAGNLSVLNGTRQAFAILLDNVAEELFLTLTVLFLLLALRAVLRRGWAALLAAAAVLLAIVVLNNPDVPYVWAFGGLYWLVFLGAIMRLGLLAAVSALFVQSMVLAVPLGWDLSTWYIGRSWMVLGVCLVLVVLAFRQSLAGRPLFHGSLGD